MRVEMGKSMEKNKKRFNSNLIRSRRRRHYLRNGVNFILAFVLSMAFVILSLLMVLKYGCFQENTILEVLSSSNYYRNNYQELVNRLEEKNKAAGLPSGLPEKVFLQEELKEDIIINVNRLFNGKAFISLKEMQTSRQDDYNVRKKQLLTAVSGIVKEEDLGPMFQEYNKAIKLPMLDYYIKIRKEYQIIYFFGVAICVSMIILIIIILIKLNGWLHRSFQYIAYGTMASALMLCMAPSVLLLDKSYNRLHLMPDSLNGFITNYIINVADNLLIISSLFALLSVIIIFTGRGIKANLLKFYKLTKG